MLSLYKKGSAMSRKLKFLLLSLIAIAIMLVNPYKLIVVRGNSMYPTLKNGNILLAYEISGDEMSHIRIRYYDGLKELKNGQH